MESPNKRGPSVWLNELRGLLTLVFQKVSKLVDRVLFDKKGSVIISLVLSIMICVVINYEDISLKLFNDTRTTVDLRNVASDANMSLFDCLSKPKELEFKKLILELSEDAKNLDLTELIDRVLEKSGMKDELEKEHTLEADIRLENLMEFKSITENYQKETGTVNLEDFLEDISIVADSADHQNLDDALTLMTIRDSDIVTGGITEPVTVQIRNTTIFI